MDVGRKRMSKRQQEVLLEKLHANRIMVRGNDASPSVVAMWEALAQQLNMLSCCRDVQGWRAAWTLWVKKVKTKARKVRDSINATGGGPAGPVLTEQEERVLEVVGRASVYGFYDGEVGLDRASPLQDAVADPVRYEEVAVARASLEPVLDDDPAIPCPDLAAVPEIREPDMAAAPVIPGPDFAAAPEIRGPVLAAAPAIPGPGDDDPRANRRPVRRPWPGAQVPPAQLLVEALNENCRLYRLQMERAVRDIIAAINANTAAHHAAMQRE